MTASRRGWFRRWFERRAPPPYCPACHTSVSVFRSAVTGTDGTIDPGYLGMYVVLALCLGAIPASFVLATIAMFVSADHKIDLLGIAAVIGAAGACFGTSAAGVGVFRAGDKPRAEAALISAMATPAGGVSISSTPGGAL